MLSKFQIYITDGNLNDLCTIHGTICVKSGVWDLRRVFIYTTQNHIKYAYVRRLCIIVVRVVRKEGVRRDVCEGRRERRAEEDLLG